MQRKPLHTSENGSTSRSTSTDSLRTKTYREKSKSHTDLSSLSTSTKYTPKKTLGPLTSLLIFALTLQCAWTFSKWRFYWLPAPNMRSAGADFSELNARQHVKAIEAIGHRLVGLEQHAQTADYIYDNLASLQTATTRSGKLKLEVEFHTVNSSHRFDIAGKTCHKLYMDVVNVVARISCDGCEGRESIVVNTHYDTNPATLGAADASVGVAIMLELARSLVAHPPPTPEFRNPVILLFNGAEETLQDGSHGWITQHAWAPSVRALINLEACGHNGREALFQANSPGLISAYKNGAKHPHGSVFGNDIFGTGLMISDTDYRQFMEYADNVVGLDFAYYTNSYVYHTMLDVERALTPGSVQHFGDNVLGVTKQLVKMDLAKGFQREFSTVYYDFFGWFVVAYPWTVGTVLHLLIGAVAFWTYSIGIKLELSEGKDGVVKANVVAFVSVCLSLLASVVAPIVITVVIRLLGLSNLAWFRREEYPFLQYSASSVFGMIFTQYLGRRALDAALQSLHSHLLHSHAMEKRILLATLLFMNFGFVGLSLLKIGSSFLLMYHVLGMLTLLGWSRRRFGLESLHPLRRYVYAIIVLAPIQFGYSISLAKLFVPLMGRAGSHTPSDVIISIVVGLLTFMIAYPLLAFSHRFGEARMRMGLTVLALLALTLGLGVTRVFPFDETYAPKRIYVQYRFNQTAGTSHIDVAHGDASRSTFKQLVHALSPEFDFDAHQRGLDKDLEWVVMYPLNFFIDSVALPGEPFVEQITGDYDRYGDGPNVSVDAFEERLVNGTRKVRVVFKHVNLILPTVTITGSLLSWNVNSSLPTDHFDPFNPMKKIKVDSHTLRISSGMGVSEFELELVTDQAQLRVDYVAMDPRSWGVRAGDLGLYGEEVDFQRRKLEDDLAVSDEWEGGQVLKMIKRRMPPWTAAMYFASVGGTWYI